MTIRTDIGVRRGNPWRALGWGGAAALLLVPLIVRFPWTPFDYVFAAEMFGLVGLSLELAVRATGSTAYRIAVGPAALASLLLIWLNGAVGIIGSENEDANLLFLAVILVVLGGSAIARFRAAGMARAMMFAAVCQLAVPFVALGLKLAPTELLLRREVTVLTLFFTGLWSLSAWLFRQAARRLT